MNRAVLLVAGCTVGGTSNLEHLTYAQENYLSSNFPDYQLVKFPRRNWKFKDIWEDSLVLWARDVIIIPEQIELSTIAMTAFVISSIHKPECCHGREDIRVIILSEGGVPILEL